ncbi:S8 family serine peptidase [Roseisolibacter agri]|uniref:Peptidase S8/S53 domain-containing protein n=1 Tax=Roseisolibacter agri TaxID=2014610 RepID=A0AA37Q6L9_9BACT|nr:S8 family serine peptidase [Roseisolibacter agri]GLC25657.1 hypothetical protein rosag_21700 [Roseisolibacter agri]
MRSPLAFPRAAVVGAALLAAACGDRSPAEPTLIDRASGALQSLHALVAPAPAATSFAFLAPLGPARGYHGTFDGGRAPVVEICRVASRDAAECDGGYLARYTPSDGTGPMMGGVQLVVDPAQQAYRLDWPATGLAARTAVRVRVLLDGAELGRAHARIPASGETAEQLAAAGYAAIDASGRLPVRFRLETPPRDGIYELPGAPGAPAASAIPQRTFRPRAGDYAVPHATLPGVGVSHNTLLVAVTPGATVAQVNALVAQVGGLVIGGSPGGAQGGVLVLRLAGTTHAAAAAALATLRAATGVIAAAAPDALVQGDVVSYVPMAAAPAEQWQREAVGAHWHHILSRVPQLWNLNGAARKSAAKPVTAVLDAEFTEHEDLPAVGQTAGPMTSHGTKVAGMIAATFDNDRGIDGLNPAATLNLVRLSAPDSAGTLYDYRRSVGQALLTGLDSLLRSAAGVQTRVVNVSMGYGWKQAGIDPTTNADARDLADLHGAFAKVMLRGTEAFRGGRLPVIVASAGNDSRGDAQRVDSRYTSPFNAARAAGVKAIISVEAITRLSGGALARATFSNMGGQLSAPGEDIRVLTDYAGVMADKGTSFAAPQVAALVGYLYALAPQLPWASVDANPMLDVLLASAVPVPGAAPRIDAFGAALALEGRHGVSATHVRRLLVDVDDGTADGNERLRDGAVVLDEDADGDGGAGDGAIDMSDFRRWRDWLLAVEGAAGLALDGPAMHPKKDVNGNHRWNTNGDGDNENVFPRGDFDGDGRLTRADLAIMTPLFQDVDVPASRLTALVSSGDVRVDAQACLLLPGVRTVTSQLRRASDGLAQDVRVHAGGRAAITYTVPAGGTPTPYIAEVEAYDAAGQLIGSASREVQVALGGDVAWAAPCARVVMTPDTVTVEPQQTVALKARVLGAGLADTAITWFAAAGNGDVNAYGYYTAPSQVGTYVVYARHASSGTQAKGTIVVKANTANAEVRVVTQQYQATARAAGAAGSSGDWPEKPAEVLDRAEGAPTTLAGITGRASASITVNGTDRFMGNPIATFTMGSTSGSSIGVAYSPVGGAASPMAIRGLSWSAAASMSSHASIEAGKSLYHSFYMYHGADAWSAVVFEVTGAPVTMAMTTNCVGASSQASGSMLVLLADFPHTLVAAGYCGLVSPPTRLAPGRYMVSMSAGVSQGLSMLYGSDARTDDPANVAISGGLTFTP